MAEPKTNDTEKDVKTESVIPRRDLDRSSLEQQIQENHSEFGKGSLVLFHSTYGIDDSEQDNFIKSLCTIINVNNSLKNLHLDNNEFSSSNLQALIRELVARTNRIDNPLVEIRLTDSIPEKDFPLVADNLLRLKHYYKDKLILDEYTQLTMENYAKEKMQKYMTACEKYMEILHSKKSDTRSSKRYHLLKDLVESANQDSSKKNLSVVEKLGVFEQKYRDEVKGKFPTFAARKDLADRRLEREFFVGMGDTKAINQIDLYGYYSKDKGVHTHKSHRKGHADARSIGFASKEERMRQEKEEKLAKIAKKSLRK